MKKVFTLFVAVLLTASVFLPQQACAQSPEKMSYQAIIRDTSDNLVTSQTVGMQISILQGSASGKVVYTETQTSTTNANGLVSIEIGGGAGFSTINWSGDNYYIETKIAVVEPLTSYTITGTSQLLSVPYALHAKTAETVTGTITESDPIFTSSQAANITTTDITKLSNLSGTNTGDQDLSGLANTTSVTSSLNLKVDKEAGKGLSTEDYTTTEKTKLAGIAYGAEVNVQADWNQATNTAGDYIKNKPTIPAAANGSETKVIAGTNITVTGVGTSASPYVVNQSPGTVAGQMLFWDGTAWVMLAATYYEGAALQMISGKPTWVGGTLPTITNPTTGKIWMDRNLGASQAATSSTDADAYGDLYQWGRGADGHQIRTSGKTSTLSSSDTPGHSNFILAPNLPYDWCSPQNTDLWQGVNGVNNPCPSGYRLPTEAEWNAERTSWSSNNSAGAFASPLKLPLAGIRYANFGMLDYAGSYGYYWSSTVDGIHSRGLLFGSSIGYTVNNGRAFGYAVRCIKN